MFARGGPRPGSRARSTSCSSTPSRSSTSRTRCWYKVGGAVRARSRTASSPSACAASRSACSELGVQRGDRVGDPVARTARSGRSPTTRCLTSGAHRRADLPDAAGRADPVHPQRLGRGRGLRLDRGAGAKIAGDSRASARRCKHVIGFDARRADGLRHDARRARGSAAPRSRAPERDARVPSARRCAVQPDDLATLIYTSGTTGDAEGRDADARQHLLERRGAATARVPFDAATTSALSFLPLSHIFERMGRLPDVRDGTRHRVRGVDRHRAGQHAARCSPTIVMLGAAPVREDVRARARERARRAAR